ncbi:basic region leucine zipper [Schizosaccharomyces cryophilus OY26]|uniref:Basic region leucine zipper n=1 Tax=Schizosaccharomyces cryophilus (strain OY26 / ATCC MYA-4695 / CBS 11777 / NBRC 106824 / NRRL Y48691) TaxID=653667 RepID=S9XER8_SCHCR|nr:basic region leucine zipper [Schizosaccharomyces cryophilus OY26]EPY52276.1 basic region leucine zipper [Schizosaccharomyces cryophilus OY26]
MESDPALPKSTAIHNSNEYISQDEPVPPRSKSSYGDFIQSSNSVALQYINSTRDDGLKLAYERNGNEVRFNDDLHTVDEKGNKLQKVWNTSNTESSTRQTSSSPNQRTATSPFDSVVSVAEDQERRRRNTLASARFRQRRKAKENYLEQKVEEYEKKIKQLEKRIYELELETKWFKDLIRPVRTPGMTSVNKNLTTPKF